MDRRIQALLVVTLLCTVFTAYCAGDEAASTENAALFYWRAFAVMPEMSKQDDETVAHAYVGAPIDEKMAGLAKDWEPALALLYRGAAASKCDWGVDYESEGLYAMLPHLANARQLARGACFHARYLMASGDAAGAARDLSAAVALGRHAANGGNECIINTLVGLAIDQIVISSASMYLTDRDIAPALQGTIRTAADSQVKDLVRKTILSEKSACLGWLRAQVEKHAADGTLAEFVKDKVLSEAGVPQYADPYTLLRMIDEAADQFDQAASIVDLPQDKFEAEYELLKQQIAASGNPITNGVFDALDKMRYQVEKVATEWAMLEAAVAYAGGGEPALAALPDPYGDGPFSMAPVDGGFELASKLTCEGEPVTVRFGPGK